VKEVILTPEGYKKLQQEIEQLSTVRRARSRIASASRASSATSPRTRSTTRRRTTQAHLEARIATLEERLKNARVVTRKEMPLG
jgi:transcription elongation factor GreA